MKNKQLIVENYTPGKSRFMSFITLIIWIRIKISVLEFTATMYMI